MTEVWRQLTQIREYPEANEVELQRYSDHDELMGWIETVTKDGDREMILYQEDETGRAIDPYRLLPPVVFDELPNYEIGEDMIAVGGSAMMAWARMQFEDVPQERRNAVLLALLGYCELDTLAMVILVESWRGCFKR